MLRRAWLVLCGLWAALMLLIGMLSYDTEWPKVFAWAAAPIIAGTLVVFALRWIVFGGNGRSPKMRIYRR